MESLFGDLGGEGEEYGDEMQMIQKLLGGALAPQRGSS